MENYNKILKLLCNNDEELKKMPNEEFLNNIEMVSPDSVVVTKIKQLKPVISRPNMSKYEFAGTITKLALYLETLPSLGDYIDEVQINGFINASELAYKLLRSNKFDAYLNRLGYEVVSYSALRINPLWFKLMDNYYARSHAALEAQCYSQIYDEKYKDIFN